MWTKFCLLLFNNEREKVIRERDKCILVFLSDPGLMSFLTFREVTKNNISVLLPGLILQFNRNLPIKRLIVPPCN